MKQNLNQKILSTILSLVLIISISIPVFAASGDDITASFECPNFLAVIRLRLDIPYPKPILKSDVEGLTSLSVSSRNITSLKGIEHFTGMWHLYLDNNRLTTLDLSKNTMLSYLVASSNQLTSLDLSKNTALSQLYIGGNQLTELDVSNNIALTALWVDNNRLTSLDVSGNPSLQTLDLSNNRLKTLPLNADAMYTNINVSNNYMINESAVTGRPGLSWDVQESPHSTPFRFSPQRIPPSIDLSAATTNLSGTGWSWVQSSKTLFLSGIDLQKTASGTALRLPADSIIDLSAGSVNKIASTSGLAVESDGNLEIRGTGSLELLGIGEPNEYGYIPGGGGGLYTEGDLTINGGIITNSGFGMSTTGIFAGGDIIINGGNINSRAGSGTESPAIAAMNITINGGEVIARGAGEGLRASSWGPSFVNIGTVSITGGVVHVSGGWNGIASPNVSITGGTVTAISTADKEEYPGDDWIAAISSEPVNLPSSYWWGLSALSVTAGDLTSSTTAPYIWSSDQQFVHITTVDPTDPKDPTDPMPKPWQPPLSTNPFRDVPNAPNWQNAPVSWASRNGITHGTSPTTFSPGSNVTRGQLVTFLYRIAGEPEVSGSNTFHDVPSGEFYSIPVLWATQTGVTRGTSPTTFEPYARITREQLATMLHRYISDEVPAPVDMLGGYTDQNTISSWARAGVNWAVYNRIMGQGDNVTRLNPRGNATRAEAVTMLYRVVETFEIPAP